MAHFALKRGLDLPIAGEPEQRIDDAAPPRSVAIVGADYVGLKPRMLIAEGESVRRGQPLFCDKDSEAVVFTAPASGTVAAINRGARRVLESVVIEIGDADDTGVDFGAADPEGLDRDVVAQKVQESGLWTAFRTRPYSKIPTADSVPAAIYVAAMDTEPLSADAGPIIAARAEDFRIGLAAVAKLSGGKTYLCHDKGVDAPSVVGVEAHSFAGPHPAGLPGTHMHFLEPPRAGKMVWTIGYQDVIEIGALFRTGHLAPERVISLAGPRAAKPRLLRTIRGAALDGLIAGEVSGDEPLRVVSGSVLSGRAAEGPFAYLGRYHRQVTLITEDHEQITLGWITPQPDKYAVQPVLASGWVGEARRRFTLTTNLNGGRRAMVPTGVFERLMPQDFLPTQLLRALLVMDTDTAQALGALELDEEDLALCTFACPAKYEYGDALRSSLAKIEKEG